MRSRAIKPEAVTLPMVFGMQISLQFLRHGLYRQSCLLLPKRMRPFDFNV
jgi:hypothetical protein